MRNQIVSISNSGLCNRLKCLITCIRLKSILKRKLAIHWPVNEKCGAPLNSILSTSYEYDIAKYVVNYSTAIRGNQAVINNSNRKRIYFDTWRFSITEDERQLGFEELDFIYQSRSALSSNNIVTDISRILSRLSFNQGAEEKAMQRVFLNLDGAKNSCRLVGIHMRRGDHLEAIKHSSFNNFCTEIAVELKKNRDAKFILCTDDMAAGQALYDLFKGNMDFEPRSKICSASESGVLQGLTDLLTLSKCDSIIGSHGSTFTELAWWLSGFKPITIAGGFQNHRELYPEAFPSILNE